MTSVPIDRVVTECHRILKRGDTVRAVGMARELNRQAPNDPRSRMIQGIVAVLFGQAEQAIRLLEQVTFELTGDDQRLATMHLARARVLADDVSGALATIEPIAGEQGAPGLATAIKAEALIRAGRLDEAQAALDGAETAENEAHHTAIARGRLAFATPAEDPDSSDREAAAFDALTAQNERVGVPASSLIELLNMLGELHARRGEDTAAAHLFKRSAGLNPAQVDPRPYAKSIMGMISSWNDKALARARRVDGGPASETQRPVFVVGMPGGGPGLAAGLLAAHPAAQTVNDPEAFTGAISRAFVRGGAEASPVVSDPSKPTGKQLKDAAERYLERTDPYNEAIERVIDANPLNLHVLGVAAQMFPNARAVFVRRDPFDACFGCLLEHADPRLLYAHDPRTLVVFAGALRRLEEHWISVFAGGSLPMRSLVIDYADLLAGGDAARGLFEFAGLDPIESGPVDQAVAEHSRWTGHQSGLRDRFRKAMPELVSAVDQADIGAV